MKLQFRVLDVPNGNPVSGVSATLRVLATGEALASTITDGDGFASFTINGTPPPCQVQITKGAETRFVSSQVEGPAGAFDLSEAPVALRAVAGVSGGVSAAFGTALLVTSSGAGDRSVSVGSGLAITPDGFLFVNYTASSLTFDAPAAANRTDLIVVDGSTAASTYGQTKLLVVKGTEGGAAASASANQTVVAAVMVRFGSSVINGADISVADQPLLLQGIRTSQRAVSSVKQLASATEITSTTAASVSGLQTTLTLGSGTWDVSATVVGNTNGEVEAAVWAGSSSSPGTYVASGTGRSQTSALLTENSVSGGVSRLYGVNARRRSGGTAGVYTLSYAGLVSENATYPFDQPTKSTIGPTYAYIANYGSNHIQVYSTSGTYLNKFGKAGTANGEFDSPAGLDAYGTSLYVCDPGNKRVQVLSISGSTLTYSSKFGSNGTGNGEFKWPNDLAINSSGTVYVVDATSNRVQRFNSSGTYLGQWGSTGSSTGLFNNPNGIAVDSSGYVYVADTDNNRVQKFSSTGTYVSTPVTVTKPVGVAFDSSGNLIVAAYYSVRVYNSSGTLLDSYTSVSQCTGATWVNATGVYWVHDVYPNDRIVKLTLSGEYELTSAQLVVTAVPRR